jgi:hypothetical protein
VATPSESYEKPADRCQTVAVRWHQQPSVDLEHRILILAGRFGRASCGGQVDVRGLLDGDKGRLGRWAIGRTYLREAGGEKRPQTRVKFMLGTLIRS